MRCSIKSYGTSTSPVYIVNNTSYGNLQQSLSSMSGAGGVGEINLQSSSKMTAYVYNNISQTSVAHMGNNSGEHTAYAVNLGGNYATTIGGSGLNNVFRGIAGTCVSSCDSGR